MNLPELAEGWYWNGITEGWRGAGKNRIVQYVISVSRPRGFPKNHSRTIHINPQLDSSEEIRDAFTSAFEALAVATKIPFLEQDKLDTLAEILDGFDDARMDISTEVWVNQFKNIPYKSYVIGDD